MTGHLLTPAASGLPSPWCDTTHRRTSAVGELAHTAETERDVYGVLEVAAVSRSALGPPPEWPDSVWALYWDFEDALGTRLNVLMPTFGELCTDTFEDAFRSWQAPGTDAWPGDGVVAEMASWWAVSVIGGLAHDALGWLERQAAQLLDPERAVATAEHSARGRVETDTAVTLLHTLGARTPQAAEGALFRIARTQSLGDDDRAWARRWLRSLRLPRAEEWAAAEPGESEEPLLPAVVRELPYGWAEGFVWPDTEPDKRRLDRAARIVAACEPLRRADTPGPESDWNEESDEDEPQWLEIRAVLRPLVPYARHVTRERMTRAAAECRFVGVPGVPEAGEEAGEEEFIERWVGWIATWIAQEAEEWIRRAEAGRDEGAGPRTHDR
ncbi:hypothetical protein ACIBO4_01180 [Streptomyces sp. NPDC050149]|uniref:hypothetical protein n=1 Tax=Streptomyces sp. NPDC050149 TaxID=3365603 RepID=UPI0037A3E642